MRSSVRMLMRAAVLPLVLGAGLAGQAVPASAGNIWTVKTAPSPSTGAAIEGGGSWVVNKPSGYYLGRAVSGSRFDVVDTTPANWHYGRAINGVNMCGWVMPGSMGSKVGAQSDTCSAATRERLTHRRSFGKDFNAAAHRAETGSSVPARPCKFHQNYFYGSDFATGGGRWADPTGTNAGSVLYRFTTLDGRAAVVRDPALGWGFLPVECVDKPATVYNDND